MISIFYKEHRMDFAGELKSINIRRSSNWQKFDILRHFLSNFSQLDPKNKRSIRNPWGSFGGELQPSATIFANRYFWNYGDGLYRKASQEIVEQPSKRTIAAHSNID